MVDTRHVNATCVRGQSFVAHGSIHARCKGEDLVSSNRLEAVLGGRPLGRLLRPLQAVRSMLEGLTLMMLPQSTECS
jgi:hypothetical protein